MKKERIPVHIGGGYPEKPIQWAHIQDALSQE